MTQQLFRCVRNLAPTGTQRVVTHIHRSTVVIARDCQTIRDNGSNPGPAGQSTGRCVASGKMVALLSMLRFDDDVLDREESSLAEVIRPKILIVDDDPLNRSLLNRVLGTTYSVIEAENGPRALTLVDSEQPDVVLLDVMMPGMTGHDVCRRIKSRPDQVLLPVILLTALDGQDDRNEGLAAGAD